jgi:signal transduction histidine kinase
MSSPPCWPSRALALARYAAAQRRALQERQAELRAARERTTALALLEERAKIARELHDVVTHRLS